VNDPIDAVVHVSQAGFCKNRSYTEHVLGLKSHIEAGFLRKLKTGSVFINLTAAYDTVWRDGLMLKFMRVEFTEQYVVKPCLPSLSW
jgi:hypothetical protein